MDVRREGRERALELLYEIDAKDRPAPEVLGELPLPANEFVAEIVDGVHADLARIDSLIERFAKDWSVERMPVVDRSVLRMATFELLARPAVTKATIINEAVELAKRFSTDESGRFVNGVLSAIAGELRP